IALGVREAARRCHCSQMTACRAFGRLQKDGLITATNKGHLVPEIGRPDIATRWKLNFLKKSAQVTSKPKGRGCFSNDTPVCFPGDTSPSPPVRFRADTSPRASLVIQSKDNLTTAEPREYLDRESVWPLASQGDDLSRDGPERAVLNHVLVSPRAG